MLDNINHAQRVDYDKSPPQCSRFCRNRENIAGKVRYSHVIISYVRRCPSLRRFMCHLCLTTQPPMIRTLCIYFVDTSWSFHVKLGSGTVMMGKRWKQRPRSLVARVFFISMGA